MAGLALADCCGGMGTTFAGLGTQQTCLVINEVVEKSAWQKSENKNRAATWKCVGVQGTVVR